MLATRAAGGAGGRPQPPVGEILATGKTLPEPVVIDRGKAESQGLERAYYRSLQGMRVKLPEGIATGGGTTKFNDVFLEPGTTAQRLFRKDNPLANNTPWHDAPAEPGSPPTAAPATRPTRACRGRARRR